MRRTFHLALPNGLFGDPLVVVRPRLVPRVLLFDAGDATSLSPRTLLGVTDVFVSHAHVDHVFGLARLLRLRLGRVERPLRLFGPPGFTAQVRSMLGAFTWNLVDAFPLDLRVIEVLPDRVTCRRFPGQGGFEPEVESDAIHGGGAVVDVFADELVRVRALPLDHAGIPSLAWRVDEHVALNVDPVMLEAAGLRAGPWLAALKDAVRRGAADDTPIALPDGRFLPLAEARRAVLRESDGDSAVYATDVAPTPRTHESLSAFARGARRLVIEAHFLAAESALAAQHGHLTTTLAGAIARGAAAGAVCPLHASARHQENAAQLLDELATAASPVPLELLAAVPADEAPQEVDEEAPP